MTTTDHEQNAEKTRRRATSKQQPDSSVLMNDDLRKTDILGTPTVLRVKSHPSAPDGESPRNAQFKAIHIHEENIAVISRVSWRSRQHHFRARQRRLTSHCN